MKRNSQKGATIVEAAVIILLLFTLFLAVIEFGRAYNVYQTMTNAAREGARLSVAPFPGTSTLPDTTAVQTKVEDFLASAAVKGASVNVTQTMPNTVNGVALVYTQVDVTAPYDFLFFKFGTINMSTQVVMRNETN